RPLGGGIPTILASGGRDRRLRALFHDGSPAYQPHQDVVWKTATNSSRRPSTNRISSRQPMLRWGCAARNRSALRQRSNITGLFLGLPKEHVSSAPAPQLWAAISRILGAWTCAWTHELPPSSSSSIRFGSPPASTASKDNSLPLTPHLPRPWAGPRRICAT